MFNIDYSRSAKKGASSEKTRQPIAANKDIDMKLTEQYEIVVAAQPQMQRPHELVVDDRPVAENEFHWA